MAYDHSLSDGERRELLRIARATLREYTRSGLIPPGKPHRECLCQNAAAFVSLHRGDALRGCIGTQLEERPLYRTIQEMATAAATRDPRFAPITSEELPELDIEISVLSDRAPITGPDEIEIGRHGIAIESQGRRGLLLPQVASAQGWTPVEFLRALSRKAGLDEDAWQSEGAMLERFTAQVFGEADSPQSA